MSERLFVLAQKLLPQQLLSRLAGKISLSRWSAKLIPLFISTYKVDMSEALHGSARDYANFHEFFTRKLKPNVRPVDKSIMVSPCDGTIADMDSISHGNILQAKRHSYTIQQLAADDRAAEIFANGLHMTIYLSPKDYHRVHMPRAAKLVRWRHVPGNLLSVNGATARLVPNLYARNERLVCHFESSVGQFLIIMVGAMLVSGIVSNWHGKHDLGHDSGWQDVAIDYDALDELGQFCFGSTVILITEQSFSGWSETLQNPQAVRLGQALMR